MAVMSVRFHSVVAVIGLITALLISTAALAHHGWRWTEDGKFELVAVIEKAKLGNPHGVLVLNADGERWTVEVGQPWRNARAGLKDEMMATGAEITIIGKRSADPKEKRVKAERVVIKGKQYDLYPERLKAN